MAEEEYKFHKMADRKGMPIDKGQVRIVHLPVKVLFEWSDKIVDSEDEETGEVIYASGYVMKLLPGQEFVYNNQESVFLASTFEMYEKPF